MFDKFWKSSTEPLGQFQPNLIQNNFGERSEICICIFEKTFYSDALDQFWWIWHKIPLVEAVQLFFLSNGKSNSLQGKMISTFNQHACTIKLCWILLCFTGERRVSWVSCFFCSCLSHHNFTLTSHNTVKCFHRTPTHMNIKR